MPVPLFALGASVVQGIGQSPIWKAGVAGFKQAAGAAFTGSRTTINTSGNTSSINPSGVVSTTSNSNILLVAGAALLALILLKK
jgi:hypothetical protein